MKSPIDELKKALTGFTVERTANMLTIQMTEPKKDALTTVKSAVEKLGLRYESIMLFRAVAGDAVIVRGLTVPDEKPQPEERITNNG